MNMISSLILVHLFIMLLFDLGSSLYEDKFLKNLWFRGSESCGSEKKMGKLLQSIFNFFQYSNYQLNECRYDINLEMIYFKNA